MRAFVSSLRGAQDYLLRAPIRKRRGVPLLRRLRQECATLLSTMKPEYGTEPTILNKRDLWPAQQEERLGWRKGNSDASSAQGELCWHWGSGGGECLRRQQSGNGTGYCEI